DLHWADEASIEFLTYACGRLEARPMCLALAWRSEEVAPGDRIRRLPAQAQRSGTVLHLKPARLGREAVGELAATLEDDLEAAVVDRLHRETDGLPFFLVEYLTALRERADAGDGEWTTPAGVRELLQARLAHVSETGWQVLTTCSVVGSSFDFDTVRDASGRGEEETIAAFEELISSGLVNEIAVGTATKAPAYDFSHERVRALVYEQTSGARRRLLHRRVAESLSRAERRVGAQTSFVAHHFELAGQERVAAEYYEQSGRRAASLFAHGEALAHFHSALALDHPRPWDLHEAIGDLLTLTGDYGRALLSYETAAALGPHERLPEIEHRLGNLHGRRGDYEVADVHFRDALEALETDDPARAALLHADWSVNAHRSGDRPRARSLGQKALGLAERAGDTSALAQAQNVVGLLARADGDVEAAVSAFSTSARLAESLSDQTAHIAALNNLALAYGDARDYERAIEYAGRALELCATQHDRHREAAIHNNLADLLHAAGRADESMGHLKEAVTIFAEIGSSEPQPQPEIWKLVEW
ncbi:MAG: ATP-binding protein, partial [Thermoleophilaceae bacterium]